MYFILFYKFLSHMSVVKHFTNAKYVNKNEFGFHAVGAVSQEAKSYKVCVCVCVSSVWMCE